MAGFNTEAGLAENLRVFQKYATERASADNPVKFDVPMVWDLYLDGGTNHQTNTATLAAAQSSALPETLDFTPAEFEGGGVRVTYRTPVLGNPDVLGMVNDRIRAQARRYPHPYANEMEAIT